MNAYAEAHPDRIDDARERVLPLQPTDVFAHILRVVHVDFLAGFSRNDLRRAQRWRRAGSNAWAVGPSRSASGNAMLLTHPHLPWGGRFTWFETQLAGPEFNAYGAALLGTPFPAVAFNQHLGWTHTVNPIDASDLYRLRLVDGGYAWNGGTRPFNTDTTVLRAKRGDGSMRTDTMVVRRSVHGPVVARRNGEALALRIARRRGRAHPISLRRAGAQPQLGGLGVLAGRGAGRYVRDALEVGPPLRRPAPHGRSAERMGPKRQ
jgi:acyl-homoserine-lactone acylase